MKKRNSCQPNKHGFETWVSTTTSAHEIYGLIASKVIRDSTVKSAGILRLVSKSFRDACNDAIVIEMKESNKRLATMAALEQKAIAWEARDGKEARDAANEVRSEIYEHEQYFAKFGSHVVHSLRELISGRAVPRVKFALNVRCDGGPLHFDESIRTFFLIGSRSCEFDTPVRECTACSIAGTGLANTSLCVAPCGNGLVLCASPACVNVHCVVFDPSSETPLRYQLEQRGERLDIDYSIPERRQRMLHQRRKNLVSNMLTYTGIPSPPTLSHIANRYGLEEWYSEFANPYGEGEQRFDIRGMTMLPFDTPSTRRERVPTLQTVLKLDDGCVESVMANIDRVDGAVQRVDQCLRRELRSLAISAFMSELNHFLRQALPDGTMQTPVVSVAELDEAIPGVGAFVLERLLKPDPADASLDLIYSRAAYARTSDAFDLMRLIAGAAFLLPKLDRKFAAAEGVPPASRYALSYVSGAFMGPHLSTNAWHRLNTWAMELSDNPESSTSLDEDRKLLRAMRSDVINLSVPYRSSFAWYAHAYHVVRFMRIFDDLCTNSIRVIASPWNRHVLGSYDYASEFERCFAVAFTSNKARVRTMFVFSEHSDIAGWLRRFVSMSNSAIRASGDGDASALSEPPPCHMLGTLPDGSALVSQSSDERKFAEWMCSALRLLGRKAETRCLAFYLMTKGSSDATFHVTHDEDDEEGQRKGEEEEEGEETGR